MATLFAILDAALLLKDRNIAGVTLGNIIVTALLAVLGDVFGLVGDLALLFVFGLALFFVDSVVNGVVNHFVFGFASVSVSSTFH